MRENLEKILAIIGVAEGGLVDHPSDPGGRTNLGVTTRVYHAWLRNTDRAIQPVDKITRAEVNQIFTEQYWSPVKGDWLPKGIDLLVADCAFNSGAAQAAKLLQRVVGTAPDGIVGNLTLEAVGRMDPDLLIERYTEARWKFMQGLKHFSTFKNGWRARLDMVKVEARFLASDGNVAREVVPQLFLKQGREPVAPANPEDAKLGGTKEAIATLAGASTAVTALQGLEGPVAWGIAIALVIVAVAVVVTLVRRKAV